MAVGAFQEGARFKLKQFERSWREQAVGSKATPVKFFLFVSCVFVKSWAYFWYILSFKINSLLSMLLLPHVMIIRCQHYIYDIIVLIEIHVVLCFEHVFSFRPSIFLR